MSSSSPFEFRIPGPITSPRLKRRSTHENTAPYPPLSPQSGSSIPSSSSDLINYTTSPTSPMKPTSSFARRRRSTIIHGASTLPASSSLPTSPASCYPPTSIQSMQALQYAMVSADGDETMAMAAQTVGAADQMDMQEDLSDNITKAMTLLSLHPLPSNGSEAAWPDAEQLLKESLRNSLAALRLLQELRRAPISISGGDSGDMPALVSASTYDKILSNMNGAKETLTWAENHLKEEKDQATERLLKG